MNKIPTVKVKKINNFFAIMFFIIMIIAIYLYYEDNVLEVSNYTISSNEISSEFVDFKIAQISDFHNTQSNIILNMLISRLEKEKPDIIVITGDLIDSNRTDVERAISLVQKISSIADIYYVTGNHEAESIEYEQLEKKLDEINVNVLRNKKVEIKRENSIISLIGMDDPSMIARNNRKYNKRDNFNNILNNLTSNLDKYTILLSHRSELISIYSQSKVNLVLSGHAHGGQIIIPFVGGMFSPNQGIFPEYTCGVYKEKNTNMIVSRGIGNSIFPFRVNNRPELVIVTLKNS